MPSVPSGVEPAVREEAGDLLGDDGHEVGDGDDRPLRLGQQLGDT